MNRVLLSIVCLLIACTGGCNKKTESATVGHRLLLAAEPYVPLMQQEVDQFVSLYPQGNMEVHGSSTRGAIVSLLNDSVYTIVTDRQFNEEERQVARQASIRLVENKIAEDAIAIIVHRQNPIESLAQESVNRIVTKTATAWMQISKSHRSGPIDLVCTGRNSGMYEMLQNKFLNGSKPLEPTLVLSSQEEVIQYVSAHPSSIGFVAASLLMGKSLHVKILPVLAKSPEGNEKAYFPGQQEIHESLYPFHYSLYLYNTEEKAAVGVGFSSLVLSHVGQKIFQNAGLVPVKIPYRTIQLQAE